MAAFELYGPPAGVRRAGEPGAENANASHHPETNEFTVNRKVGDALRATVP